MDALFAGQILVVDWRDGLPTEPNKRRPAIVIDDREIFDESFSNVIVVPLTEHPDYAVIQLTVRIEPSPENGCRVPCYAVAHNITTISRRRVQSITPSHITKEQLALIRGRCAESIGL